MVDVRDDPVSYFFTSAVAIRHGWAVVLSRPNSGLEDWRRGGCEARKVNRCGPGTMMCLVRMIAKSFPAIPYSFQPPPPPSILGRHHLTRPPPLLYLYLDA